MSQVALSLSDAQVLRYLLIQLQVLVREGRDVRRDWRLWRRAEVLGMHLDSLLAGEAGLPNAGRGALNFGSTPGTRLSRFKFA